eukprot:m.236682 g.236682  ORF g.236682 m.236682 type:complete len:423 (+) comp19351_c0_seq1:218-1486(+)
MVSDATGGQWKHYNPSWIGCIILLLLEQVYCVWIFAVGAIPFVFDLLWQTFLSVFFQHWALPARIDDLLDPKVYSRMVGYNVASVQRAIDTPTQHANCTDREWLTVRRSDRDETEHVFAKIHSTNVFIRGIMCIFDVYRNELDGYANVSWTVRVPTVFCAKWTPSRFCLILEDLRQANVTFPNLWSNPQSTIAQAPNILSTLAHIHADHWNNPPSGCWNDRTRPYMGTGMGLFALWRVNHVLYPNLIPADVEETFKVALWNWGKLRTFWSKSFPKTMVHGDTHLGNFFYDEDAVVGTFDLQCKAEEHPMRDISYFLCCSYPTENISDDEQRLVKLYLKELEKCGVERTQLPSLADCWFQYRLHVLYTMYAFTFSAVSSQLMDEVQTRCGMGRVVAAMRRLDVAGALRDILDGTIRPPPRVHP